MQQTIFQRGGAKADFWDDSDLLAVWSAQVAHPERAPEANGGAVDSKGERSSSCSAESSTESGEAPPLKRPRAETVGANAITGAQGAMPEIDDPILRNIAHAWFTAGYWTGYKAAADGK